MNKKKMDNSEVVTVNCRLEALQNMMKSLATTVDKINAKPSFTGAIPKVVANAGGHGGVGEAVIDGAVGGVECAWPHLPPLRNPGLGRVKRDRSPEPSLKQPEKTLKTGKCLSKMYKTFVECQDKRIIEGAEAAPVYIFVGNTNRRESGDIIKMVLIKCTDNMPEKRNS